MSVNMLDEPSARREPVPSAPRRRVSWPILNLTLDALLLVLLVIELALAVIVRFAFPPGTSAGGWRLWGAGYDDWAQARDAVLAGFTAAVVVHVMWHWTWVCGVIGARFRSGDARTVKDDGSWTLWGVILLIGVLHVVGLSLLAATLSIQRPA